MSLNYDCVRYGSGAQDWRLVPRGPIQTRDSAAGRPSNTRRARTRDELLEPMTSGKTISRGTIWDGTGVNAKLDEAVSPVREFVAGFIPGNVVHAVDPGTVISLGRTFLPQEQDEERREALSAAMDEAEEEWRKDKRSTADNDLPPGEKKLPKTTEDARAMGRPRNYLPGTNRGVTTQRYQDNLREGRAAFATRDQTRPVPKAQCSGPDFARLHDKSAARGS